MDVAVGVAVPVGLVRWPDPPGTYTLVVKQTFELGASGRAALAKRQDPPSAGKSDAAGHLLEPCDFVEAKSQCDVVVVAFPPNMEAIRIRVGPLDALMSPLVSNTNQDGACAPPEQRMPFPTFPLELEIGVAGRSVTCALSCPAFAGALLAIDHTGVRTPIPLRADTVVINLARGVVCVTFRGTFHHAGDIDGGALLAVADNVRLASASLGEIALWPRQRVSEGSAPKPPPRSMRVPKSTIVMSSSDSAPPSVRLPKSTIVMRSSDLSPPPQPPGKTPHGFDESVLDRQSTINLALPLDLEPESSSLPTLTMVLDPDMLDGLPTMELIVHKDALSASAADLALEDALTPALTPDQPPGPPAFSPTFGPKPEAVEAEPSLVPQLTLDAIGLDVSFVLPFGSQPQPVPVPPAHEAAPMSQRTDRTMPIAVADVQAHLTKKYGLALPFIDPSAPSSEQPPVAEAPRPVITPPNPPSIPRRPGAGVVLQRAPELASYQRREVAFEAQPRSEAPPLGAGATRKQRAKSDAKRIEGLSFDEYTELRGAIWAGLRPKREVLREYGLSPLTWRLADQAWMKQIDATAQDADQAASLIASIRIRNLGEDPGVG